MFNVEEKNYNNDCDNYYKHLNNLDLQVRLKKLYDLIHNNKNVKKIKFFKRYSNEFKKYFFEINKTIIEEKQNTDKNPEFFDSNIFLGKLFDILEAPLLTESFIDNLNCNQELEQKDFLSFFNELKFKLKIPDIIDLNFTEEPIIKNISFGHIKDIPFTFYDQKSFERAEALSSKKESFLYEYISQSLFNLFMHFNDLFSINDTNNIHFIFSKNNKGYKNLTNIILNNNEGVNFIFQDLNEYQNIFLNIIIQKNIDKINRYNYETFLSNLEQGVKFIEPINKHFQKNDFLNTLRIDFQKKIITANLDITEKTLSKKRI